MFRKFFALLFTLPIFATPIQEVRKTFFDDYIFEGESTDQDVMLCLHGFGMDKTISYFVHDTKMTPHHLVGFNFPDWGDNIDISRPETLCFGTILELKPVIDRMHACITELNAERIHLYGFSAGGGAAVNVLAVLKNHRFQDELGLTADEMDTIYAAVERGSVLLDCPLKSTDEICDELESGNPYLKKTAEIYIENDLRPIDSLLKIAGSKLNVVLVLQQPDDILSNRDDALFIERLEEANRDGRTVIVLGPEGYHIPAMPSLVEGYKELIDSL